MSFNHTPLTFPFLTQLHPIFDWSLGYSQLPRAVASFQISRSCNFVALSGNLGKCDSVPRHATMLHNLEHCDRGQKGKGKRWTCCCNGLESFLFFIFQLFHVLGCDRFLKEIGCSVFFLAGALVMFLYKNITRATPEPPGPNSFSC